MKKSDYFNEKDIDLSPKLIIVEKNLCFQLKEILKDINNLRKECNKLQAKLGEIIIKYGL